MKMAIDIGYGDTKVIFEKNGSFEIFKFPTAIENLGFSATNFGEKMANEYEFNGFNYRVGEATFNTLDTRTFNFLKEYSPLIIYHALKIIEEKISSNINPNDIELRTGLSILNWDKRNQFLETIKEFVINKEVIRFSEIKLFAQGQGIYLDTKYKIDTSSQVVVIDIGYNTLDVLTFKDNKAIKNLCYAIEYGIYKIVSELKNLIDNEYKTNISEQKVKEAFQKGYITLGGKKIDLQDLINKLKIRYTKDLINTLESKSKNLLLESEHIILSGGGAYYLDKDSFYENMIFSQNPYEFANVRGYYNG